MIFGKKAFALAWGGVGLLLLVVTPAYRLWEARAWLDQIRLTEILLFVWMLPMLLLMALDQQRLMARQLKWQLWALLCLGSVSAVLSPFSLWPWVELGTFVCLVGLCLVVFFTQQQDARVSGIIINAMFAVVVLLLTTCAASLAMVFSAKMELRPWILLAGFDNPRWLGQFQAISLPVLALLVVSLKTRPRRTGAFLVLALWWSVAMIQGSRGVWVSMGATMFLLACFRPTRWWSLLQLQGAVVGALLCALLLWVLVPLYDIPVGSVDLAKRVSSGSAGRFPMWAYALEGIIQHPFWGMGPMSFQATPGFPGHPHNALIQIAYEWGVPALCVLLAGVFTLAVMAWRKCNDGVLWADVSRSFRVTVLLASLLAAGIDAMVSGVIVMPYSQMWLAVVIGVLWFQLASPAPQVMAYGVADRAAKGVFGVLVFVSAIGLAALAVHQYEGLKSLDLRDVPGRESPRFWYQGSIQ